MSHPNLLLVINEARDGKTLTAEEAFGEVLRQLRRERGLSQEQLAEASSCHRTYISFLERGLRSPTLASLLQLSLALNVPAAEMVRQVEASIAPSNRQQ